MEVNHTNSVQSLKTVISSVILALFFLYLMSCAASKTVELTPEQIKARQDSIRKAELAKNKVECLKLASLAFEYHKNKDFERAVGYLWRLTKECDLTDPDFSRIGVYYRLSDSYMQMAKTDSIVTMLELCVEKEPNETRCHHNLAYYYDQQGRDEDAVRHYLEVIRLIKDKGDKERITGYWRTILDKYIKLQQYEDALHAIEEILVHYPDDLELKIREKDLYGLVYGEEGRIRKIKELIDVEPTNMSNYLELVSIYENRGETDTVLIWYNRILELDPQNKDAWFKIGTVNHGLEQYNEAINAFEKVVGIDPQDKTVYVQMADSYNQLNKFSMALSMVNKAINVDDKYGMAYRRRAEVYERSADQCAEKKKSGADFDDKLMYQLSIEQCSLALDDFETKEWATQRIEYLEVSAPQKGDYFFNKSRVKNNRVKIQGKCYSWLKQRTVTVPRKYQ